MQKLFEGGKGSVFQKVLSWVPSNNHQLQLAGALAIANFARNGKSSGLISKILYSICQTCFHGCKMLINRHYFCSLLSVIVSFQFCVHLLRLALQ